MAWPDQNPPATDVILHHNVPCAGGSPAYLEIDKLPDGLYRATVGTLFEFQEVCRTRDLEALVRHVNWMAGVEGSEGYREAMAESAVATALSRIRRST